ncbi:MAG: S1C family serine protease [Betaproteobacteria bacterium]
MNPRLPVPSRSRRFVGFAVLWLLAAAALVSTPGRAADTSPESAVRAADEQSTGPDAEQFFRSIVKIEMRAVPDARSLASLGATREGTGIVIADDGLILTIGYLLVEADEVRIVDSRGRTLPARVVGYDHATGLGVVRTIVPLAAPGLTFGDSGKLAERATVLVVNFAGAGEVTLTRVVSKRPFTASWEYQLDQAIFTSPPAPNWSGAALVDRDLKLVGIGSLIMRELPGSDVPLPGNMFVPIDALKPILADLVKNGRRAGPARPWLGVAADEFQGRLVVTRVSPDGPADDAGVKAGDIILGVAGDSVRTQDEFYRKVWGRGGAGAEIPLRVLQGVDVRDLKLQSIDRVQYFRPVTTY